MSFIIAILSFLPIRLILTCLIIVSLAYLYAIFPSRRHHPDLEYLDGQYIAHRGLHDFSDNTPENSIPAFRAAMEAGLPIETDIHLTKDGEVVVFHDDTLTRACGDDRNISDLTYAELETLCLFHTEERIPTLCEVLRLVDGQVPLLIEFKAVNRDEAYPLCEKACEILDSYDGPYLIQSFYPFVLRWFKKNRSDVCRGQLSMKFDREYLSLFFLGKLIFNCLGRPDFISYGHVHANTIGMRLNRMLGAETFGWTYQNQEELDSDKAPYDGWIFEDFKPKDLNLK